MTFLEGFLPDLTQKMFLIADMQDVPGMMWSVSVPQYWTLNHVTYY